MLENVWGRLLTRALLGRRPGPRSAPPRGTVAPASGAVRCFSAEEPQEFDRSLLKILVCPLSKKQLRYEPTTNELINEELGIAYPIVDGIPNMIPQEARLINTDSDPPAEPAQ